MNGIGLKRMNADERRMTNLGGAVGRAAVGWRRKEAVGRREGGVEAPILEWHQHPVPPTQQKRLPLQLVHVGCIRLVTRGWLSISRTATVSSPKKPAIIQGPSETDDWMIGGWGCNGPANMKRRPY